MLGPESWPQDRGVPAVWPCQRPPPQPHTYLLTLDLPGSLGRSLCPWEGGHKCRLPASW